jgi:hypothetical protein
VNTARNGVAYFEIALLGYSGALLASPLPDDFVVVLRKKPCHDTFEPSTESIAMAHELHTYADLLEQIHNDLRIQHPEWIQQDGQSPTCDSYEARLMELLDTATGTTANETTTVRMR